MRSAPPNLGANVLALVLTASLGIPVRARAAVLESACAAATAEAASRAGPPKSCTVGDTACLARRCGDGDAAACVEASAGASGPAGLALLERACRLGRAPACFAAAERHVGADGPAADPCYEALLRRGCALGDRIACAWARLCDQVEPSRRGSPADLLVDAYLRGGGAGSLALVDEPAVARSHVASLLAEAPDGIDPDDPGDAFDALLAATREPARRVRASCAVGRGSEDDRALVAPVVFRAANAPRLRTFAVEVRGVLDRAELVVARCRCEPDEVLLVDAARRKIIASRMRRPPPRQPGLIRDPGRAPTVTLDVSADAPGATIEWQGRTVPLPFRLEGVRELDDVRAIVRAPGRAPAVLDQRAGIPREPWSRAAPLEQRWFVVLRPAADNRGARP